MSETSEFYDEDFLPRDEYGDVDFGEENDFDDPSGFTEDYDEDFDWKQASNHTALMSYFNAF